MLHSIMSMLRMLVTQRPVLSNLPYSAHCRAQTQGMYGAGMRSLGRGGMLGPHQMLALRRIHVRWTTAGARLAA